MNLPDPQKTFYATSDASCHTGGFTVWQKDIDSSDKFIAAFSRTFTKQERLYDIHKLEILALTSGPLP